MKKLRIQPLCFVGLLAALCATSSAYAQTSLSTNQGGVNARIEVLGGVFTPPAPIAASQSRIVVYRAANPRPLPGATGVFIDGQYHTSLVVGGYSALCMRPGSVEVGARQFRVGQNARDSYDAVTAIELPGAQTQYIAVEETSGRPVMRPVSAAQAFQELGTSRLQMHTISRVSQAQNCVAVGAPPVPAQPDQYILSSDALFAFGRSDLKGLSAKGRAALDLLTARIRKEYLSLDKVHVIGHADPLGSPGFNERLSVERANTIVQYLKTTGQISAPMTSEGRGAREPVETRCGRVATNASIACNQPNRRVVTEVSGQRR